MLRFAADEDFDGHIIRGLLRRNPEFDIVRVQDAGLHGTDDPQILAWAAEAGRVLLTHDVNTMTRHAIARVSMGMNMPGVFEVPQTVPTQTAIEDLLLIAECSLPGEWEGQVNYLPLRR